MYAAEAVQVPLVARVALLPRRRAIQGAGEKRHYGRKRLGKQASLLIFLLRANERMLPVVVVVVVVRCC